MGYGTLIQRITYKVSGRSAASSGLYTPMNDIYDYAVGGIPFTSATGDSRPDMERPVQQKKQQFDNYKDPGEYSLDQWWLRSQTSFVGGAGIIYQDPDTQGQAKNIRFAKSIGVDPFSDQDLLSLLRETELATAIGGSNSGFPYMASQINSFGDCVWVGRGEKLEMRKVTASDLTIQSTATLTTSGPTQGINGDIATFKAVSGSVSTYFAMVFVQDLTTVANAGIWRVDEGSAVATRIYLPPANQNFPTVSKARGLLAYGSNEKLYMLDPYAAAGTALPASPNASVPIDQVIVAITDGPDAVYVGANDDSRGYIYKTTFNNTGVVNGLTLTAILPDGEMINDISAYVNTYLVITSNSGIRVGTFSGNGVQYGPQILTVDVVAGQSGFGKIAFYGTRAYVATLGTAQHDGAKGIMAIDLSVVLSDQNTGSAFNPYCTWVYHPNNLEPVYDVAVTKTGRVAFTADYGSNAKAYIEHDTTLIASGYLDTGRCRFNTVEPKLFKYVSVRTPALLTGELTVTLLDDGGGQTNYLTYGPSLTPGTEDIATPTPAGPRNWEAFRFTLRRGTDITKGGQLDSWQIKALPGVLKQRVIIRNFNCFNIERDKSGQVISRDSGALDKLVAIRQMCQRGDTVTYQDLAQSLSTQVIIDDYQFTMLTTPGPNKENFGGYLTVTMRTVADAVPNNTPITVEGD